MSDTIPTIRLDDLAEPRYSPEMAEILAGAAQFAPLLTFEPEAILNQAIAELGGGLTDFGPDLFREPLELLCELFPRESGDHGLGLVAAHTWMVGAAKNRLALYDLVRRHPEIRDIPIERPIVIVGQPRTGTTHLHNLLSADPALRSLPYWESIQPVPFPADAGLDPDPRRERCAMSIGFVEAIMPHFKRMHEMTVDHVHEEIQLLANSFSTMLIETMAPMPAWRDWYLRTDQTPFYAEMKLQLQAMTFLRGGGRWVLKSPQHLEQLPALDAVFPDATVLITHRDPVSVTISLMTMMTYSRRVSQSPIDPHEVGAYWAERNATMLESCVRDRGTIPADRSLDVVFHEFMADDLAMVERIYDLAGQPLDVSARDAHARYLAHHQRDRHGKVVYDFEPFGVDPRPLRERFRPYTETFGVRAEWPV